MRTRSCGGRPGRLRTLAAVTAVLAGAAGITGAGTLTAITAKAATCGITEGLIPRGDAVMMTASATGLRYVLAASAVGAGPGGVAASSYAEPGGTWSPTAGYSLSTTALTKINSFGMYMGYYSALGEYLPGVAFNSCVWKVQLLVEPAASTAPASGNINQFYTGEIESQIANDDAESDGSAISITPRLISVTSVPTSAATTDRQSLTGGWLPASAGQPSAASMSASYGHEHLPTRAAGGHVGQARRIGHREGYRAAQAVALHTRTMDPDHPGTLQSQNNLAAARMH